MDKQARILIIDDEESIRFSLRGILEDEGHTVIEAASGEEGLEALAGGGVDMAFLDIWLPGMDGLEVLARATAEWPDVPVIMISGHGTIETAVTAIKRGAHDFIEKPLSLEKVVIAAARASEFSDLKRENETLRLISREDDEMLGLSAPMLALKEQIQRVAPTDAWVLITGENGTGKELAARAIHRLSRRAQRTLVAVNCAAIPEELIESELFGHEKGAFTGADQAKIGKFEMAHNGTLFLDEIGDMSLKTQAKILRILQEQKFERVGGGRTISVNVRVVAATNKDLEDAIQHNAFREDLYYRLRVFPLALPPLRERTGDVPLLLNEFSARFSREYAVQPITFTPSALDALSRYSWPGNVRELRNLVERMLILHQGSQVQISMLPAELRGKLAETAKSGEQSPGLDAAKADPVQENGATLANLLSRDFKSARAAFEALFLARRLEECNGNISRLAESVGLERSYIYRKLKHAQERTPEKK